MQTYFCKLVPPRSTFVQDLTPAEGKAMQEHAVYWKDAMSKGKVALFGLVGDPAGAFGIGILEVADLSEARRLTENDPAVLQIPGARYEIHPMPRGAVHS